MTNGKRTIAGLALGMMALAGTGLGVPSPARADEVDDYTRKLVELDQRVQAMSTEFREAPPPSPDLADRRVLDAQVLFSLKNYEEAATILLDVVEKYPNSRAYDDAVYLLGESLFQARDYYPSRQYFTLAVKKQTNSKAEQQALQRLIEIALRTGDYEQIDDYLNRLQGVPPHLLEPGVPYVRAKYLYFRGKFADASAGFASIPPSNAFYFQARYFLATVMVRTGDLAGASVVFDSILKLQPPDDSAKEIQDLARLALGRILYERSQFDRAIDAYGAVGRQSRYFTDALYEQGWTHIKAKNWKLAYRSLDLLLLTSPDHKEGPELRLLMGNLNLFMENFFLASDAFSKSRDEFEPIHRQLQVELLRAQQDPQYFDNLVGKNLDKFDIGAFIPASATKWVQADPDVARMLTLASDVGDIQRALKDSEQIVTKLERAMQTAGKAGIFPDLAAARTRSVEVSNQLVETRQKFVSRVRAMLESSLSADERKALDHLAAERTGLEKRIENLPLTRQALKARDDEAKKNLTDLDGKGSELNVEIQSLEAQLVAIEQYYRSSRAEQKIRPEDIQGPVKDLRAAINELHTAHDKVRDEISDAIREASTAGAAGEEERQMGARLADLLKQEQAIQNRAKFRQPSDRQLQIDRCMGLLARADQIDGRLKELDKRIDAQAEVRLEKVRGYLATEKEELKLAGSKLGVVMGESQSLGGGLAQAMFAKVADRFYDLVVKSDVGIIDVAWGLKDQKTKAVTRLTTQKNLEIKALDEDFRRILEEDK
jgi:tetratricopeptide (TPR) repeat protein